MVGWTKKSARPLVRNLIAWHVWCDQRDQQEAQTQLAQTLTNGTIAGLVRYRFPGGNDTIDWLRAWRSVAGAKDVAALLAEQDAQDQYALTAARK